MQFQVPQFIDTEDKIVGPFSLRQFIYVGVAAFLSAIAYFLVQTWLFIIIFIIVMSAGLALAFFKVNGRPLIKVGVSAFNFYWKPQMYVWKSENPVSKQKEVPEEPERGIPLEAIVSGAALHKSWEKLQTGTPDVSKQSDRQFLEKKMEERYQIFRRQSGARDAARRVDYR